MSAEGPPRAEIPDPDKWVKPADWIELEEPDDAYWKREIGWNPMREKNWTKRIIGTAIFCPACGRATIGETNWCPFCTSEAQIEESCQENSNVIVEIVDGRMVIYRNDVKQDG